MDVIIYPCNVSHWLKIWLNVENYITESEKLIIYNKPNYICYSYLNELGQKSATILYVDLGIAVNVKIRTHIFYPYKFVRIIRDAENDPYV